MTSLWWLLCILTITQCAPASGQQMSFLDSYLGCAYDGHNRDLTSWYGHGKTIEQCRAKARADKKKFFAVQNGGECRGGNKYGKYRMVGADSECAQKGYKNAKEKAGERMQFYGGDWKNAVYLTKEQWFTIDNTKKDMFQEGHLIGCYHDNNDRQYDNKFQDAKKKSVRWTHVNAVEECGALAVTNKMPYFAVQNGDECRMSKTMFPQYPVYPPTLGATACDKAAKKSSKKYGNFAGGGWKNSIYYTEKSKYYPAAYWMSPDGDNTIRLAWANAYCLNVEGGKEKEGAKIIAYWCVDKNGKTSGNMKFVVEKGLIKCKAKPDLCISFVGKKPVKSGDLVIAKCGKEGTVQKINMFDDKTIRFVDHQEFGFNVYGGIGGGNNINGRKVKTYPVTASNNEAFLFRTPEPPTPRPTPVPTPTPPLSGLKKAKGWNIAKGDCTIDISSGPPCAVSPNYPKPYKADDTCLVKLTKTEAVKPEVLITEQYFDEVKIGSVKLSGQPKEKPTIPVKEDDTIEWTADFYLEGKGWKICKTKMPEEKVVKR